MNQKSLEKFLQLNGLIASSILGGSIAATLLLTLALFAASPFISDKQESAIWKAFKPPLLGIAVSLPWLAVSAIAFCKYASSDAEPQIQLPPLHPNTDCISCEYWNRDPATQVYLPCSVHPLGKPEDLCPDWKMIDWLNEKRPV